MRGPLSLRPPRAATTMPTAAHTPRACAMCESYPASVAPERARCARATPRAWRRSDTTRHLDTVRQRDTTRPPETPLPPGHRAPERRDAPAGDAAAPRTPCASATPAARRRRCRPQDAAPACGASRAPDLRCPLPTWPAMATPFAQQSTAHPCISIALKDSATARQSACGAQAHSRHTIASAQAHVHSQRPSAVHHVLPARPRASSLCQWACHRYASPRLLSRGLRSRRPRSSAALRGASRGHGLFSRKCPLLAPSPRGSLSLRSLVRFAQWGGRRRGCAAIGARAACARVAAAPQLARALRARAAGAHHRCARRARARRGQASATALRRLLLPA